MAERTLNWTSLTTVASVAILVGTELLGIAWATGWALAGFMQLGPTFALAFQGILALLALFAVYVLVKQAVRVEPIWS
jgi:hypothetical protein